MDIKKAYIWIEANKKSLGLDQYKKFISGLYNLLEDYATMAILDEIFMEQDRSSDYYYSGVPVLLENSVIPIMTSFKKDSIIDMGFALFAQGGESHVHKSENWSNICKVTMARSYMLQSDFINIWMDIIENEENSLSLRDELNKLIHCESFFENKSATTNLIIGVEEETIKIIIKRISEYVCLEYGFRELGPLNKGFTDPLLID